jgi:hypothetical protein
MKESVDENILDVILFIIISVIFVMLVIGSLYGFIMLVSKFIR